jgi:hypothetical protein
MAVLILTISSTINCRLTSYLETTNENVNPSKRDIIPTTDPSMAPGVCFSTSGYFVVRHLLKAKPSHINKMIREKIIKTIKEGGSWKNVEFIK